MLVLLYINSINFPPLMIINRIYETQKPSVDVAPFHSGRAKDLSAPLYILLTSAIGQSTKGVFLSLADQYLDNFTLIVNFQTIINSSVRTKRPHKVQKSHPRFDADINTNLPLQNLKAELNSQKSSSCNRIHNMCMYVYIGFKTFFYVVRHLDSIASLSSHWPSVRFLSFMAFFIPSIQFFFGLPRALFYFGIHFNAILGNFYSAIL